MIFLWDRLVWLRGIVFLFVLIVKVEIELVIWLVGG